MDKKLTVSLDQTVIEKAKQYAKENNTSLSKMIEAYFDSLTKLNKEQEKVEVSPLVESLCGIIQLPKDFDFKKAKKKYIMEKYK